MTPNHVAIILDGNRRFAKRLMLEPHKGHEYGAQKVEELINMLKKHGIKELTLYCLSCENIKNRPEKEINYLFDLFKKEFKNLDREKLQKNKIKIRFIGDLSQVPDDLKKQCESLESETKNNKEYAINFAIAYGGRQELVNAFNKIVKSGIKNIDEKTIADYLYLKSEPDLIIRTGGEKRTSNFLPWQSVYSEWIFLDKMWPEFDENDLISCIKEFEARKRNFGK